MSLRIARIRPLLAACNKLNTKPAFQPAQTTSAYSSKGARKRRKSNNTINDPLLSPSPVSAPSESLKKSSNSQNDHHDRKKESKSHQTSNEPSKQPRTLRPLTLLLICIPIGYAVRWYTSDPSPSTSARNARTPDGFTKYTLLSREFISPTLAIFTLAPASPGTGISSLAGAAQGKDEEEREDDFPVKVQSVEVKQPLLQIARQYTLLPHALPSHGAHSADTRTEQSLKQEQDDGEGEDLRLLVRREERGEVSGYLFRLGIGSEVQVRGPNVEFGLRSSDLRKEGPGLGDVLFLAGGTGVATAMGLVGSMSEEKDGVNSDVRLLWAVRRREECLGGHSEVGNVSTGWFSWFWKADERTPSGSEANDTTTVGRKGSIVKQLEDLQSWLGMSSGTGKLSLSYYVDEENTFIRPGEVSALMKQTKQSSLPGKRNLLVVSGPEGFVKYWAGPKVWDQGRELQGPLGGVLAQMDMRGWDVLKL